MMDDEQLWDEVRKQIANAPERNAPPGAWDAFHQQLPEVDPVKPAFWSSKFLLFLLPVAFAAGLFMQPDNVEYALTEAGFPLEEELEVTVAGQKGGVALATDVQTVGPSASIQAVKSSASVIDTNQSGVSTQQIEQLTSVLKTTGEQITEQSSSTGIQSIGTPSPTPNRESDLMGGIVNTEANNYEVSIIAERSEKLVELLPVLESTLYPGDVDLAMTVNTVIAKKPINAHQRIILAASLDSPLSDKQRPSMHLSYRGSAWLGNLSWMAHLSHYRPRFGENLGSYGQTDFNLSPYQEDNSTITAYSVEQEKLFAGIGLGYTFDVPSTRFSVYPFVSALYLILNNGEIQVDQFDELTETSATNSYTYVNNDSSPNRYLLHGGVDVQYRVNRRWVGALSIQRNTTFAMEEAYWQFRAGVHYMLR